jgi:hypothetical protein
MTSQRTGRRIASNWTLLTSHGLVLLYVASKPDATIRQIAGELELSERRVADIILDLSSADLLTVRREGRRNHYTLNPDARFRHQMAASMSFNDFVDLWKRSTMWDGQGDSDRRD